MNERKSEYTTDETHESMNTVDCRYNKHTVSNNEPTKQLVCSNLRRDYLHLAQEQ